MILEVAVAAALLESNLSDAEVHFEKAEALLNELKRVAEKSRQEHSLCDGRVAALEQWVSAGQEQVKVKKVQPPSSQQAAKRPANAMAPSGGIEHPYKAQKTESAHLEHKVPVKVFYASSCVLLAGRLDLRPTEHDTQLVLCLKDIPQRIQGKAQLVKLTAHEMRDISFSEGRHKVHISGSKTDVSDGSICIAFSNDDRMRIFLDMASVITGGRCVIHHEPLERMDWIFTRNFNQIEQAYARRTEEGQRHSERETDELVQYEDDRVGSGPQRPWS